MQMHNALSTAQQTAAVRYFHHVLHLQILLVTENLDFDIYSIMNERLASIIIFKKTD